MNHIYQRYLKLSKFLVPFAKERWQAEKDPVMKETYWQGYVHYRFERMKQYKLINSKHNKTADTFNFRDKSSHIDLVGLIRNDTSGVWNE